MLKQEVPWLVHSDLTDADQPKPVVKQKDRDPAAAGLRDAAYNRSASFNYFLSDRFEAGVALRGTEVKSIREGKANLKDAYGLLKDGECFCSMRNWPFLSRECDERLPWTRKLLLHKTELREAGEHDQAEGIYADPDANLFSQRAVKCELALAKGKQDWDKRETERKREADNEVKAAIARSQRR